ncbi:hypothetical protein JCM8547_003188 [Rhodosporidiobolus lusitaniae]
MRPTLTLLPALAALASTAAASSSPQNNNSPRSAVEAPRQPFERAVHLPVASGSGGGRTVEVLSWRVSSWHAEKAEDEAEEEEEEEETEEQRRHEEEQQEREMWRTLLSSLPMHGEKGEVGRRLWSELVDEPGGGRGGKGGGQVVFQPVQQSASAEDNLPSPPHVPPPPSFVPPSTISDEATYSPPARSAFRPSPPSPLAPSRKKKLSLIFSTAVNSLFSLSSSPPSFPLQIPSLSLTYLAQNATTVLQPSSLLARRPSFSTAAPAKGTSALSGVGLAWLQPAGDGAGLSRR